MKCPNCGSDRYCPVEDGRKECIMCGTVFGEIKETKKVTKDVLLG